MVREPPCAVEASSLGFTYHREPVLHDVSLQVKPGEMIGLLGPNGAGKSTLLRLIAGTLNATSGGVSVKGKRTHAWGRSELSRTISVVPQDFAVHFAYSVRQIVALGRTPHQGRLSLVTATDEEAVNRALRVTGTLDLAEREISDLSGGERQRVVIAMALAQQPSILLLDEPTAHLDIKHQVEILDLIQQLNREQGITVIATMHDLNLTSRYFPRLVLMCTRILADGPPSEVLTPQVLRSAYGAEVQVGILRGEEHLTILPVASPAPPAPREQLVRPHAHIFAGGGSGELLLRAFADASIPVTVGPLNVGDSDFVLAQRLKLAAITEPPFAPVSAQGIESTRDWIERASAVVVCPMPLGHGNISLLREALAASERGQRVILLEPESSTDHKATWTHVEARDFSSEGPMLYQRLIDSGAQLVTSVAEVVRLVG